MDSSTLWIAVCGLVACFSSCDSPTSQSMIFCLLGNSIWHFQHSFAFWSSSKKQRIRGLLLWCISVNGRSFADWGMSCVHLVRIGLQGFLCLPPFSPWASHTSFTRALFEGALRIHGLRRKSICYIELVTKTSTNYMITVHRALLHPFLAILSPH